MATTQNVPQTLSAEQVKGAAAHRATLEAARIGRLRAEERPFTRHRHKTLSNCLSLQG